MRNIKRVVFSVLVLCAVLALSAAPLAAQDAAAPKLYLGSGQFDPLDDTREPLVNATTDDEAEEEAQTATPVLRSLARTLFGVAATTATVETGYYIVQFTGPVKAQWKTSLTDLGAVLFDYIPQYAFIIKLDSSREGDVRALDGVRWLGEYEPDMRLSTTVYDVTPEALEAAGGLVALRVMAFPGEDAAELGVKVRDLGGEVTSVSESSRGILMDVSLPVTAIEDLAKVDGVKWVESAPKHRLNNNKATDIMGARAVRPRSWAVGGTLYGQGQVVAIADSGLDTGVVGTLHDDFGNGSGGSRVQNIVALGSATASDEAGHGTHVAGGVVGNGANSGATPASEVFPATCFAGLAPKATLYFQAVGGSGGSSLPGIPSDLTNLFSPAYDAGARVHTNSWGTSGFGGYSSECATVDQFMWDHKNFLVLFAAGNAGYDTNMNGVVDDYKLDTPGTAKNCLCVGASESLRSSGGYATSAWGAFRTYASPVAEDLASDKPYGLAAFSSHGPTLDGRWKPEVVAPGTNIVSTRSSATTNTGWGVYDSKYLYMGGTSMATPLTAGAAVLMREYLMEEESFATPSAALVKTALINGATSLTPGQYGTGAFQELGTVPDRAQGWGRVNLAASLNLGDERKVKYWDVTAGAPSDTSYEATYTLDVADDGQPLRATLGWTDYPGSTAANGGLVNDLDLRVKGPDGTWHYPDNARNLSAMDTQQYVTSVDGIYTGDALAMRYTPSAYPSTLESVGIAFKNATNTLAQVSVVVYAWTGSAVGAELLRKDLAYLPTGETLVPLGVNVASGSVVVSVECANTGIGIYCKTGNSTGRAFEKSGSSWVSASVTPGMNAFFRTQPASTSFDRVNNTVSVTVSDPDPGTWTAEVTAHNIPHGPQPYALVMSGLTSAVATSGTASVAANSAQPDAPNPGRWHRGARRHHASGRQPRQRHGPDGGVWRAGELQGRHHRQLRPGPGEHALRHHGPARRGRRKPDAGQAPGLRAQPVLHLPLVRDLRGWQLVAGRRRGGLRRPRARA